MTLQALLNDIATYGPSAVSVALMVIGAAHLPKAGDSASAWWAMIRSVLDYFAQNYSNARNAK